jgi:DNA-binding beta-propeller fold protein YncE
VDRDREVHRDNDDHVAGAVGLAADRLAPRRPRLTLVVLAVAVALALCVGLAVTFATAAHGMRTVFVSNSGSNGGIESITPFSVNSDGSLVPSPVVPVGDRPEGTAVTPDARFLYVATSQTAGVRGYSIASGGALTEVAGSPFASGGLTTTGVAVTPSGNRLLVTNRGSGAGSVAVYDINQATGTLTSVAGSPFAVAELEDPSGIAIAPNGGRAFVAGDAGATFDPVVAVLDINQTTGALSQVAGSPFLSGGKNSFPAVISPDGERLFIGNVQGGSPTISVLDVSPATGALTPVTGSPFASVAAGPIGLALAPDGTRLFSAERVGAGGGVSVYDIGGNGALTAVAGSPFSSGGGRTEATATTPDGERVYGSANSTPGLVAGFSIGAAGALAPLTGSPYPTGDKFPNFLSIAMTPSQTPRPAFVVSSAGDGQASSFDASAATTVPGGRATRFDWSFGDGTTLPNGGATPQHTYGSPGTYAVDLTVTNDCSDAAGFVGDTVFTGQTAHCNGSPRATACRTLDTVLGLSGPTITLKGKKTQKGSKLVKVKVKVDEAATVAGSGTIKVPVVKGSAAAAKKKKSKLKGKTKDAAACETVILKLKLKKKARKLTRKAQRKGKKPKAKVRITATDAAGNERQAKRKIRLKKK